MNRVTRFNGSDKITPNIATLLPKIALLLMTVVEKLDEIRHSFLMKAILRGRGRVVMLVERAVMEEYTSPVESCEPRNYLIVGSPSSLEFGGFIGCIQDVMIFLNSGVSGIVDR